MTAEPMEHRGSLAAWLDYVERQHPKSIALGLERVGSVRHALERDSGRRFTGPVITVGGTNGKGSTCFMLEAILRAGGYQVFRACACEW